MAFCFYGNRNWEILLTTPPVSGLVKNLMFNWCGLSGNFGTAL